MIAILGAAGVIGVYAIYHAAANPTINWTKDRPSSMSEREWKQRLEQQYGRQLAHQRHEQADILPSVNASMVGAKRHEHD